MKENFYICLCDPCETSEEISSFDTLRRATEEARELQRILSQEKKDEGFYYGVFDRVCGECVYKPIGY